MVLSRAVCGVLFGSLTRPSPSYPSCPSHRQMALLASPSSGSPTVQVAGFSFNQLDVYIAGLGRCVRILEATSHSQEELVDRALNCSQGDVQEDPYGAVLWPAATTVSNRLCELDLAGKVVLELGAGTGLVSLVAACRGAARVIASDFNPLTLQVLARTAALQDVGVLPLGVLETRVLDVKDLSVALPAADYVVIADLLYDKSLGIAVAKRVFEATRRGSRVIVGDSPCRLGRPHMLAELKSLGVDCAFTFVEGRPVDGERHSLISSATPQQGPLSMGLLEL